jgi:hypothetical protein
LADTSNPAQARREPEHGNMNVSTPATPVSDDEAARLVHAALRVEPLSINRQVFTQSGNAIFQAELADGRVVAVRVSPHSSTFAFTSHNLDVLRQLGLPVSTVLASGTRGANGSFVILDWIPGRDLQFEFAQLNAAQATHIAGTVADWQRRVASLPKSNGFGWAPIGGHAACARWTDLFGAPSTETPLDSAPRLEHLRHRLRLARRSFEPYFATLHPTCFLDDLTTRNVIVERGVLRGLIDVDFVCYGDPLMAVGTTLAHIAADVGEAGRFYGEELVRCSAASTQEQRAIHFYSALWITAFLAAAEEAGLTQRADELAGIADTVLNAAESGSL